MNIPNITNKQREIVELLYRYRFLDRIQVQTLLKHKNRRRINEWLQDLRNKHYIEWIYSTDFTEKTKPATYYLGINGVRYLKTTGTYPAPELRKRYYENKRSAGFISRSKVLADISIELAQKSDESVRYGCQTAAEYAQPASAFHFLAQKNSPFHPDICFTKQDATGDHTYLLELFDATLPRYRVKRKLKVYVDYLDYDLKKWQNATGISERPIVLIICPTVGELLFCKRRVRKQLESVPDRKKIFVKFAALDEIKQSGVISEMWERA